MAKSPLDDPFDREVFYRGEDPDAAEEEDYELLPPDEEVLEGEKRRAAEVLDHASKAVDIDELYRQDELIGTDDLEEYWKQVRFRFGIKHLLLAMTLLAVMFAIGRYVLGGFGAVMVVLTFLGLAGAYTWITWQENQRRAEWEQKRDELYRRHRERHDSSVEAEWD